MSTNEFEIRKNFTHFRLNAESTNIFNIHLISNDQPKSREIRKICKNKYKKSRFSWFLKAWPHSMWISTGTLVDVRLKMGDLSLLISLLISGFRFFFLDKEQFEAWSQPG